MKPTRTSARQSATRVGVRLAAATLLLVGGFALKGHPVSAATQNGVATITDPVTAQPLTGANGSAQLFSVALPAQAACSGDTQNTGYHVYSFLDHTGTDVTTITFNGHPSTGFGLLDNTGKYYGTANTAPNTGQVINIPTNFQWSQLTATTGFDMPVSDLLYSGGSTGSWDAGLVCADTNGAVSDWWTTNVTFTAAAADPNGFTWTATPSTTTSGGATTTTVPAAVTTTTKPPKTTTTIHKTTTTTTPSDGSTTTTIVGAGTGTTVPVAGAGTGTSTGVDPVSSDFDSGATSGTLPRTGAPVHRELGFGLFAIGAGFMLIGLDLRWKARGAFVS